MAKLSDIYGRKSIYILDILLFAIGSFITITSFSIDMLILGRAIQGIGAGRIFPVLMHLLVIFSHRRGEVEHLEF